MAKPIIIAHRGDAAHALENSLEAFRHALSVPVDMIEFDVRKGRDNILYVMHDRDTGRTADRSVNIERAKASELARVRLKNGEPIPTLRDVLDVVAGAAALNIEIKSKGAGALVAELLKGSGYPGNVILSSFQENEVDEARRVLPGLPAACIFDSFSHSDVSAYTRKGYRLISLNRKTVTQELIKELHEQDLRVYVWTVDIEDEIRELVSWGVDGIYSNDPHLLKRIVG
ncbi:MAG: glycerophosphodiester phosphodiesterase [Nitrospirota bacterium]